MALSACRTQFPVSVPVILSKEERDKRLKAVRDDSEFAELVTNQEE